MRGLDLSTFGLSEGVYAETALDWNQFLERLAQRYGVDVISIEEALCWNGFCPMQLSISTAITSASKAPICWPIR